MGAGFIAQELLQMIRLRARYWQEYWNYLDLASSLAVVALIVSYFCEAPLDVITAALSLVGLLFATRILQIATPKSNTGPLILAVVRMFADISMFLLLYVYILLAFAAALNILAQEGNDDFGTYGLAVLTLFYGGLGEFQDPLDHAIEDGRILAAILVVLYVILSSIILINLLIAIMASTWGAIEHSQHAHYHMLRLRLLNEYLCMQSYERLPPPFSIMSLFILAPLRCLFRKCAEPDMSVHSPDTVLERIVWAMIRVETGIYIFAFTPLFLVLALLKSLIGGERTLLKSFICSPWNTFLFTWWEVFHLLILVKNDWNADVYGRKERIYERKDTPPSEVKPLQASDAMVAKINKWSRELDGRKATTQDIITILRNIQEERLEIKKKLLEAVPLLQLKP
mmetsp:Transcript_34086/g.84328  ORF Transcript_34086/g.84328 Transcript_34086/m.84328 type:complete len:398 (+) Transcript_34086:939-2132(+)